MPIDTFVVFVGVYPDAEAAEADYDAVKALHADAGLLDAYDAAVVVRNEDGKVHITKKHETPTRVVANCAGSMCRTSGTWTNPSPHSWAISAMASTLCGSTRWTPAGPDS